MYLKKTVFYLFILASSVFFLNGCMPSPYYQKSYTLPGNEWAYSHAPAFKFEIDDTAAMYNLYFIIRHTEAYPFSNIWLWIYTKQPGEKTFQKSRIEIPLAEPSGKWLGRGMGEIWEQRMPITQDNQPMVFSKPGIYEIRFEQNMRINPLPEILQVGLRVANMGHRKAPITAKKS
ncbi:MAG TPA: gliding motility lipoprotein GldH [Flavipsychrobacter sp.]|nr:gliding motility lipoprotein GldH [Flavipsychrobacter sp.]